MSDNNEKSPPLTAAELLRQKVGGKAAKKKATTSSDGKRIDIDDEIQRLEAELQNDSSSSDDEDDDSESYGSRDSDENDDEKESSPSQAVVLNLSSVRDERIEKLPESLLPASRKRSLQNIDGPVDEARSKKPKKKRDDGLTAAVKEVLAGYKPRSAERLPFYCRVCAKQYDNEEEFFQHKSTEFHKTAVEVERKTSYCKLCRKQLTSPAQLKEHLTSRPHKERLHTVQAKQQGRGRASPLPGRGNNFRGGRGGRVPPPGRGRGRSPLGRGPGGSRRQWA